MRNQYRTCPRRRIQPACFRSGYKSSSSISLCDDRTRHTRLLEDGRKPVNLKLPDFTLTLKDGTWRRQPKDEKLATDSINRFVDEWRHARALTVDRYSGKRVHEWIKMGFARDGKQEVLRIGILAYKPDFILYRKDEGLEYHFPEDTGKRLLKIHEE